MKLDFLLIFFSFFWILSCENKHNASKDLIPKDKMVEAIAEIEITQALVKLKFNRDTISSQELYKQMFDSLGISEERFNKSMKFYCKSPLEMDSIYTKTIDVLEAKIKEISKVNK